jgi:predicted transcriptional regulator
MNDAAYKLMEHLYHVVPQKQSATEILNETFGNTDNVSVNQLLGELVNDGYVYQWKDYADNKSDQYGMTPKGIIFYDNYEEDKKTPVATLIQKEPLPVENAAMPAQSKIESEEDNVQNFSFRRAIPAIMLIVFAIALVWFITHVKKTN